MLTKLRNLPVLLFQKWKKIDPQLRESLARAYFAGMALFVVMIMPYKGGIVATPALIAFFNVYIVDLFVQELKGKKYKWNKPLRFFIQLLVNIVFLAFLMLFYRLMAAFNKEIVIEPLGFSVCYYIFFRICRRLRIM